MILALGVLMVIVLLSAAVFLAVQGDACLTPRRPRRQARVRRGPGGHAGLL